MRRTWLLRGVLCILLASQSVQTDEETPATTTEEPAKAADEMSADNSSPSMKAPVQGVIQLTARNFNSHVWDGHVWLVEFYAPWCSHCTSFASTYKEIAEHFHAIPDGKIKVGRVDGDSEKALASRFGVSSYPSFFVVRGLSVYEFSANRSKKNLMDFVDGGYKKTSQIPFYSSPMGPLGLLQALLISTGISVADTFRFLQDDVGVSPLLAGGIMFGTAFIACFIGIVFLAIVITPKTKLD